MQPLPEDMKGWAMIFPAIGACLGVMNLRRINLVKGFVALLTGFFVGWACGPLVLAVCLKTFEIKISLPISFGVTVLLAMLSGAAVPPLLIWVARASGSPVETFKSIFRRSAKNDRP